jgi:putative YhgA-like transposase
MAVRTQVYQGLLWRQVIDEQQIKAGGRLPPLVLLVLYNGERRWKAATTTRELIACSPDSTPWPWQPQVRYRLLDMGSFPKHELARRSSLVALLFRLEQRHSPGELKELVHEVIDWFRQHEGYERLQGLFTELIREACAACGMSLSGFRNLLEVKTMLSETIEGWKRQWKAEAKAEGEAQGVAEGIAKGMAKGVAKGMAKGVAQGISQGISQGMVKATAGALISLLEGRFGAVAPSWRKRIRGAELATLERWFKRAIDAPDLRSVFNSPR